MTCMVSSLILGLATAAPKSFSDVQTDHWAKEEIDYLIEKKVINGYPNGKFGPEDPIKRIDAATMMVRALGLDTSNPKNPNFKDVKRGTDRFEVIATVVEEGIFGGVDGYFYPNKTLTRAELAAIVNRAFKLEKKTTKSTFKDVPSKHWAYADIQALVAHGITTGYPDNTFKPNQPIKRAEFSAFMYRAMNKGAIPGKPGEETDEFKVIDIY